MGQFGQNRANLVLHHADLLIGLGTRYGIRQTGNDVETFKGSRKVINVNIDPGELADCRIKADIDLNIDLKDFFEILSSIPILVNEAWKLECLRIKESNPVLTAEDRKTEFVNPYVFSDVLSDLVDNNAIILPDAGQNVIVPSQAVRITDRQRFVSSWGNSPMGFSMPASIGAALGNPGRQVVCIIGDGGIQVNIQDLQTIRFYNIPVKIFVINNLVYGAILEFQDSQLDKRYIATDGDHGYSVPNYSAIANAYGLHYEKINSNDELKQGITKSLEEVGPVICEVMVSPQFRIKEPEQKPDLPLNS
jgi:acetolactate synthase-1/2/3 large subunit